jgi:hypothetical protein
MTTARANRPLAVGEASWSQTELPPADWPAMVTFPASPPKCPMLDRTQRSAACWSNRP